MKLPEELQFIANARMVQRTTDARMDGQVCIITGATSGVGYQAAKRLAQGGAQLILVSRNGEKAARLQEDLKREFGVPIDVVLADFARLQGSVETLEHELEQLERTLTDQLVQPPWLLLLAEQEVFRLHRHQVLERGPEVERDRLVLTEVYHQLIHDQIQLSHLAQP